MIKEDERFYTLHCDACGKESRVYKETFNKDIAGLCEHNNLYCQYCSGLFRNPNKVAIKFVVGMAWTVEKSILDTYTPEPSTMEKARAIMDKTLVYNKGGLDIGNTK